MEQSQYPGLEVGEDLRQQKSEWIIQRIAWALLFLLLIGIVLGLFGRGPLSDAEVGTSESQLQMEYQRFMRYRSSENLRLTIEPASDTVRVMLDSDYARHVQVQNITPQPDQMVAGEDALTFVFNAVPSNPMSVVFYIQPETVGNVEGWIALEGDSRHEFSQFVYP